MADTDYVTVNAIVVHQDSELAHYVAPFAGSPYPLHHCRCEYMSQWFRGRPAPYVTCLVCIALGPWER